MTSGIPSLLDAIFGKQSLEDVSLDEIYSVIGEFPSFNAAHFLLSKKLKKEDNPAYTEETKKTALYFNNPVWLQSLLDEDLNPGIQDGARPFGEAIEPASLLSARQDDDQLLPFFRQTESVSFSEETEDSEGTEEPQQEYTESIQEAPFDEEISEIRESGLDTVVNEEYAAEQEDPEESRQPTINEEYREPFQEITVNEEYAEVQKSEPIINEEFAEEPRPVITVNEEYAMEEAGKPIVNQEFVEERQEKSAGNPSFSSIIERTESWSSSENGVMPPPINPQPSPPDEISVAPPFDAKNAESIVFAPYHMIDYFASQGIKLVLEDQPADSFGKQLKSFTDWLKVMKRLPQKNLISERTDEREAERIRHFAANSIEERDILTETMAEVLAKQGMYENAIALYQKLSLIYPPKSAYFASRIEQLKASLS